MSVLSQFLGGERISSLVGTPFQSASISLVAATAGCTSATSGTTTAGQLITALSVTGRGRINWAAVYNQTSVSRTVRAKVTIDGVVMRDYTSPANAIAGNGIIFIGTGAYDPAGPNLVVYQPLRFTTSLLIEVAASDAGSGLITYASAYELFV